MKQLHGALRGGGGSTPSGWCAPASIAGRVGRTVLLTLMVSACGSDSEVPPSPVEDPGSDGARDRVVAAALSAIDSTTLPWTFIESFLVNSTLSGVGDPFSGSADVRDSPLDLLDIQDRGFGICTACPDSARQAHAWVTLANPVPDLNREWVVPYTMSVREWGSRSGHVRVKCVGGACRAIDGRLDSLDIPTPSCCPVFVRVVRPRR